MLDAWGHEGAQGAGVLSTTEDGKGSRSLYANLLFVLEGEFLGEYFGFRSDSHVVCLWGRVCSA